MAEMLDLVPAVIDIKFPGDVITSPIKQGRDNIPYRCAAGMTKMQIAGRIGGNVLDVDPLSVPSAASIRSALFEDSGKDVSQGTVF